MKPLYVGVAALALAAVGGYFLYTKSKGTAPGGKPGELTKGDGGTGGAVTPRALTPDQVGLVTTLLGDYVALAPTPVPGCATATLIAGRQPQGGETVSGSDRVTAKIAAASKVGDIYVDTVTAGVALTGATPPGGVAVTIVDSAACPGVVANLVAAGWYLYAKKSA